MKKIKKGVAHWLLKEDEEKKDDEQVNEGDTPDEVPSDGEIKKNAVTDVSEDDESEEDKDDVSEDFDFDADDDEDSVSEADDCDDEDTVSEGDDDDDKDGITEVDEVEVVPVAKDKKEDMVAEDDDPSETEKEKMDEEWDDEDDKPVDMDEAVEKLFQGQDLSEDFKKKVKTVLEVAVNKKAARVKKSLKEQATKKVRSYKKAFEARVVKKLDVYCEHVAKEWMKENKIALCEGTVVAKAESFLKEMTATYRKHNVVVPANKHNLVEQLQKEVASLRKELNESTKATIKAKKEMNEGARRACIAEHCKDLPDTKKEKFKKLAEGIAFRNKQDFMEKLTILKEEAFAAKVKAPADKAPEKVDTPVVGSKMSQYLTGAKFVTS